MTTICLTMIVRDESAVLARCLASVRPLIDTWCIVDTGSTDHTQAVAERALKGIPGVYHHRPWVDFAHNRSEAFALSREMADYHLVIDADDVLDVPAGFALPELDRDAYRLRIQYGGISYERLQLFRSALPWRYVGVLHEHPTCDQPHTEGVLDGVTLVVRGGGARSRDPEKYKKDAATLDRALIDEPGNTRYAFYLAQSYRDAGLDRDAIDAYARRVRMDGWAEEVYVSLLNIARASQRLGDSTADVRDAFLRAYNYRPSRAEALVELAALARSHGEWPLAYLFAEAATRLPRPADLLFVEDAAHGWRALDELAVAACWLGHKTQAHDLNLKLLAGLAPASETVRIAANLQHCIAATATY